MTLKTEALANENTRGLRLAIVSSSLGLAGAEKQTVYITRAFLQRGVDVRFFYLGAGGYYETVLRKMGVPVNQIYSPNRPWVILAKLIRALWRLRPHIVLVSQFGDLLHGGMAGRCCNALTLGSVRSDGVHDVNAHGRRSTAMLRLARGFVANSYRAKQNLMSRRVKPHKIEVLPNVIDLQDFDSRSTLPLEISLPSERVIVAAVGRLHTCKRFDRFIDALARARRREPRLAGIIAGADYGAKAALQERANEMGLVPHDLAFLGECGNVPALLARTALLVLTSDYEGFPNVILEAMAARRPVITTPVGDSRLIVQHGQTGYVVEGENIEEMAGLMVRLAQSSELRTKLGEAGRKRVEQEYNYELLPDRLMKVLRSFAKQTRRSHLVKLLESNVSGRIPDALIGPPAIEPYPA